MTTIVYSTIGEKFYQGQFDVELDSPDLNQIIELVRQNIIDELHKNGVRANKEQYLYSLITDAWMRDFLSEDTVNLGEIEVSAFTPLPPPPDTDQNRGEDHPQGDMITLTLIPIDKNLEAVKIPYPGDALASEVIADIRDYYSLGPNEQIKLWATSEGQGSPISSSAVVKDLPGTNIYWNHVSYV
jgi:hypothetical protein